MYTLCTDRMPFSSRLLYGTQACVARCWTDSFSGWVASGPGAGWWAKEVSDAMPFGEAHAAGTTAKAQLLLVRGCVSGSAVWCLKDAMVQGIHLHIMSRRSWGFTSDQQPLHHGMFDILATSNC